MQPKIVRFPSAVTVFIAIGSGQSLAVTLPHGARAEPPFRKLYFFSTPFG